MIAHLADQFERRLVDPKQLQRIIIGADRIAVGSMGSVAAGGYAATAAVATPENTSRLGPVPGEPIRSEAVKLEVT
jgi:hypothetical protein